MITSQNYYSIFIQIIFLKTMYEQTRQTSDLRIELIEQLEELDLTPCELICKFTTFLDQGQLESLQDSIQREEF